uniref:SUI1 domain-containing protein n=1 Tax=Lotharella globosa TaxID=91324 RepID=A0A7S3Z2J3_9EUKA|eukprot:CAMPEP_0167774396 /NCGR_PEP_ID=MMETSP0111_2-20121227/1975_1 /TAXON_ID=91324 /ORGANISM="Lotharella globosa, Strain CCCM811" /LENGTH=626 /DNA_ID=CAMNT_0007664185 /DNA_START=5 /DNA_END=1885 /DNA_ORIENTATION=-
MSNPLKGSAMRKLKAEVESSMGLTAEQIKKLFPSKAKWIANKCSGKVLVYTEARSSEPLFFHLHGGKGQLIPTVYLLWRYPNAVPIWRTPPNVWKPLSNGADLMLPGVIPPQGETGLGQFKTGAIRAVALYGNPAPVGVGVTTVSSDDIKQKGMSGKGLAMMHLYADYLYALGSKCRPNEGFLKSRVVPIVTEEEEEKEEQEQEEEPEQEDGKGKGEGESGPDEGKGQQQQEEEQEEGGEGQEGDGQGQNQELQQVEAKAREKAKVGAADKLTEEEIAEMKGNMDGLIEDLFFRAIVSIETLPLPAAELYTDHMLTRVKKHQKVEFKKSTYKKLANLVKHMEREEVIAVKQRKDGAIIVGINRDHPTIEEYEEIANNENLKGKDTKSKPRKKKRQPGRELEVRTLYQPGYNLKELVLKPKGLTRKLISMTDARKALWSYVKENELETNDHKGVNINGPLHDAMMNKGDNRRSLSKRDLAQLLAQNMTPYHCIMVGDDDDDDISRYKRGNAQPIVISQGSRQGNKSVTIVEGLEAWEVEPKELAGIIRRKYACSTTTQPYSLKQKEYRMMVAQGDLKSEVKECLCRHYGVPGQYVTISSKTTKAPKKTKKTGGGSGRGRAKLAALMP